MLWLFQPLPPPDLRTQLEAQLEHSWRQTCEIAAFESIYLCGGKGALGHSIDRRNGRGTATETHLICPRVLTSAESSRARGKAYSNSSSECSSSPWKTIWQWLPELLPPVVLPGSCFLGSYHGCGCHYMANSQIYAFCPKQSLFHRRILLSPPLKLLPLLLFPSPFAPCGRMTIGSPEIWGRHQNTELRRACEAGLHHGSDPSLSRALLGSQCSVPSSLPG